MTRAEEVVAALTKAERAAVGGSPTQGSTKPNLVKKGLMELREKPQTWKARSRRYEYHLTSFGLEVRALLLEKKDA